jgi:Mn2+/Fe2+ NRAMP family transporter
MQFYLQASVVEKVSKKDYWLTRLEVIFGCVVTDVVAFFICAATLFNPGSARSTMTEAAIALKPFASQFASLLIGVGLVNASLLSAAILPMATAYSICEGMGFESGMD